MDLSIKEEVKACRGVEITTTNKSKEGSSSSVFRLFCVTAGPSSSSVYATDISL